MGENESLPRWTDAQRKHLVENLRRYGLARDRAIDHERRTVTITDDEAVILLDLLGELP